MSLVITLENYVGGLTEVTFVGGRKLYILEDYETLCERLGIDISDDDDDDDDDDSEPKPMTPQEFQDMMR